MTRVPWRVIAGVGCVSCAILVQEIAITRILSVTSWYHFAFLVISLALFGLSGAAVTLHLSPKTHRRERLHWHLMLYATWFSLSSVFLAVVLLWTPLSYIAFSQGLAPLLILFLLGGLPFFAGGMCLALVISRLSADVNRIYAADLVGAGVGCVIAVPALSLLGGGGALLATALLGSLAAIAFGDPTNRQMLRVPVGFAGALLVLVGAQAWTGSFDVRYPKSTTVIPTPQFTEWNAHSRVTVSPATPEPWTGARDDCPVPPPPALSILLDSSAETQILVADSIDQVSYLRCEITALPYLVAPPRATALIIGPGGGKEVWTALLYNARHVTGVEINAIIVRDVMTAFATEAGGLYGREDVDIEIADARSYIRSSTDMFDVIQASQVDTWAATSAGALALSENTLYTTEAFVDYFTHLTSGGLLSMTRWLGDDTLRIISTVRAAGAELGWPNHEHHMFVAAEPRPDSDLPYRATVVVTPEPLATGQVVALEQFAMDNGFDVLYSPSGIGVDPFMDFVTVHDLNRLTATLPRDLSPVTDDRPFFFQTARIEDPLALVRSAMSVRSSDGLFLAVRLLIVTGAVAVLFLFGPLSIGRGRRQDGLPRSALGYFALLGTGFIIIEISLLQRFILFLGHPTYALTVVLFTLLTGGGLGSRLSRAVRDPIKGAALACAAIAALNAIYGVGLPTIFDWALAWPVEARIALAAVLLLPLGVILGIPLPAGVRSVGKVQPGALAWVWAINGATSVFGSVLATILAITLGFTVTAVVGAVAYALASSAALLLGRTQQFETTPVMAAV